MRFEFKRLGRNYETMLSHRIVLKMACLCYLILGFQGTLNGIIILQTVSYPPNALAGWRDIDFDGDGGSELSFRVFSISGGGPGTMSLFVQGSENTEIIREGSRVSALDKGDTVSPIPIFGQWQSTSPQSTVPDSANLGA